MKKRNSKIMVLLVVCLIIASIGTLIYNLSIKKEHEVKSRYYTGFISRVQRLEETLTQKNDTRSNGDPVQMLDVYTSIILVNDRLNLLKNNTKSFTDIEILINDFLIFRDEYGYLLRNQLEGNGVDSEVQLKVANQIKLFLSDLPKEYENSREFSNQFRAAEEHIKPLLHLNY